MLLAKIEELQAWNNAFEESWLAQRIENTAMEEGGESLPAEAEGMEQTGEHPVEDAEVEGETVEPSTEKDAAAELAEKVLELIRTNTQSEEASK